MVTDIRGSRSARTGSLLRSLLAGGIALAALGAGIIALQGNSSSPDRAEPATAAVTAPSTGATRSGSPVAVYLVDSAEAAVEIQHRMAALTPDGLARDATVMVAGTTEADTQARAAIRDLRQRRGAGGVSVFDLRRPDPARADAGAPTCAASSPDTVTIGAC